MLQQTYLHGLIGGILIGLASLVATALSGKIPGISGIFGRLLVPVKIGAGSCDSGAANKIWRLVFLIGLVAGAAVSFSLWDSAAEFRSIRPLVVMAIAGGLVGFGTRLGGGCTSGHGVCGVGLGAKDSIVATLIFVGVAMATVFVYNQINQ